MESFDVAIIGAGPGGYVAAIRAAQLGLKTCLIEKQASLGGTCLNVGCIPSKALLESSELYHAAGHDFADHGVVVGELSFNLAAMQQRKERIVKELTDGVAALMKRNKVTVLQGRGRLAAPDRVVVRTGEEQTEVSARSIILATGSQPMELPFLPFDGRAVVHSTGALSFDKVPGHLVVVGAGAVGLELGSVWRRLGARVTVVEMLPQIAPFADRQIAKTLQRALKDQGLKMLLKTRVMDARVEEDVLTLTIQRDGKEPETLDCDRVLVAVGRRPFTEGLGLEEAGVEKDSAGRVLVDDALRSSVEGVYAIGDLVRGPMLAHKAEEEGVAVAERIAGQAGHVNYDVIPGIIYTSPELAVVGINEDQAKEKKLAYRAGRFLFRANGRAKALGQEQGMVKILADSATDALLGVEIVGPWASELIAEAVVSMEFGGSAEDLARTIHAHPTLSEVVKEAALAVDKRAIHG